MEGCLAHSSSVLHVPAVLSVEVGVGLGAGPFSQLLQQGAPFELETEGRLSQVLDKTVVSLIPFTPYLDGIKLFGFWTISVPVIQFVN